MKQLPWLQLDSYYEEFYVSENFVFGFKNSLRTATFPIKVDTLNVKNKSTGGSHYRK